ncbi:hypothetical protein [Streptomyces sp. Ru62]
MRAAIARYVIPPSGEALTAVTLWVAANHIQPALQHALTQPLPVAADVRL